MREAMQARAAFIMVFPQDAEKLTPTLREAVAAGVRVFVFSADLPEDACTCALFTDERQLGQMAGEYVVSALKTKAEAEGQPGPAGRVVLLRGDEESASSREGAEGFVRAMQPFPGIVLVHDAPADWSEKGGADRIREALRIQKRFDVIYAQNDLIAVGASKAVRESSAEARESMLILGTDGVPGKGAGVAMVISGELDATVYHPPLVDAAWPVMQSILDHSGTAIRKHIQVKPFIITPENAARIQRAGLPLPDTQ
jgi:ribose transport system substrate-binding protein